MAKRQKLKERIYYEEIKGEEEEKLKSVAAMTSDDDDEANADFSLSIVEKHLLMRAAKLCHDDVNNNNTDVVALNDIINMNDSLVVAGPSVATDDVVVVEDVKIDKKKIRVRKRKKKKKEEIGDHSVTVAKEEQNVEAVDNGDDGVKAVEISDNIVLRKLLRGPRYFDPPDSGWQTCYNCGEEGHMAVNCTSSVKRKKPCFICGSSDHGVRQCSKAQGCFICKKGGHRAKDCPDKPSWSAQVCLKCGDSGHDMFTCRTSYSLDDLKEVQCYICKSFGHLCCFNVTDAGPREHTGLACSRSRGENVEASPGSCYKCGGEGHFAHECASSAKVRKWNIDTSSPILRPHGENKDYSGVKSAPHDLGKARKKKKTQHQENGVPTPQKSKQRGGWITDDTGGISFGKLKTKRKHWRSPGTPPSNGHKISALTSDGHFSSPQTSKEWTSHHAYSASRFNNLWQ